MMSFRALAGIRRLVEPTAVLRAAHVKVAGSPAIRAARSGADRAWALRRRGRTPLPFLYAVHPEARMAPAVEVGLTEVPVDEVRGTAVGGDAQRGSDFRPFPERRSANWQARWARIIRATSRLEALPPGRPPRHGRRLLGPGRPQPRGCRSRSGPGRHRRERDVPPAAGDPEGAAHSPARTDAPGSTRGAAGHLVAAAGRSRRLHSRRPVPERPHAIPELPESTLEAGIRWQGRASRGRDPQDV